jgi:PAS domain S-box-containing protein
MDNDHLANPDAVHRGDQHPPNPTETAMTTRSQLTERQLSHARSRFVASALGAGHDREWPVSADIMLVARMDGTIIATNPTWTALLGWAEQDLVGGVFFDLVHPDDRERTIDAVAGIQTSKTVRRFDNRCRHKDGSDRWIVWTAAADAQEITAVGRDVTVEKMQAEALLQAEAQLRQSQKMEAIGQLTGGLAHDFNNLLTVIAGNLELLHARLADGERDDLTPYIAAAQGASKRAAALSHRLLAFSRQQTLDPRPTDINRLIGGMADLIRRAMGPTVAVELALAADPWASWIDRNQFENALLNLCNNARDAMPVGGWLTVETVNMRLEADLASICNLPVGDYVAVRFSDTGCGMAPEVIARAFAPFFTTKRAGEGTGLGLSMIHGFVRQSNGHARIESEPCRGTTVWLYLPRYLGTAEDLPAAEEPASFANAPRTEQGETVLVVDDEPTVLDVVTEVLEDLGYTALTARNGAAGLAVLRSGRPIDLLITDIGLPGGMDGQQMATLARTIRPGLKVMFITGYVENGMIDEAQPHILTKPFAMKTLACRIKDIIAKP